MQMKYLSFLVSLELLGKIKSVPSHVEGSDITGSIIAAGVKADENLQTLMRPILQLAGIIHQPHSIPMS